MSRAERRLMCNRRSASRVSSVSCALRTCESVLHGDTNTLTPSHIKSRGHTHAQKVPLLRSPPLPVPEGAVPLSVNGLGQEGQRSQVRGSDISGS